MGGIARGGNNPGENCPWGELPVMEVTGGGNVREGIFPWGEMPGAESAGGKCPRISIITPVFLVHAFNVKSILCIVIR